MILVGYDDLSATMLLKLVDSCLIALKFSPGPLWDVSALTANGHTVMGSIETEACISLLEQTIA